MDPLHRRKAEVLKKDKGSLLAEDSKAWGRDVGSLKGAHKKVTPFQSLHEGCALPALSHSPETLSSEVSPTMPSHGCTIDSQWCAGTVLG